VYARDYLASSSGGELFTLSIHRSSHIFCLATVSANTAEDAFFRRCVELEISATLRHRFKPFRRQRLQCAIGYHISRQWKSSRPYATRRASRICILLPKCAIGRSLFAEDKCSRLYLASHVWRVVPTAHNAPLDEDVPFDRCSLRRGLPKYGCPGGRVPASAQHAPLADGDATRLDWPICTSRDFRHTY
jgi:hypothetical protein